MGAAAAVPLLLTQLDHKVWTTRDGAPAPILQIALDHDGTLWLTSFSGLYRFDGLQFKEFRAPEGEPGLHPGAYRSVFVAKNGDIWAGSTIRGIARIRSGHVKFYDEHDGFPSLTVLQICEGPDDSIWAVVHGRLMVFDGNHWTDAGVLRGIPNGESVTAIFFDHEGTQWISTVSAIYYRPRLQQQFSNAGISFDHDRDMPNFAESKNGELWIVFENRLTTSSADLQQLDVPGHRVKSPKVIHVPFLVTQMNFASDGSLWVTGNSELDRFEPSTTGGTPGFSREVFGIAQGLTSKTVNDLLEDRDGDIWLATDGGLERFRQPVLIKYVEKPLDPSDLALARDAQGTIWIGSAGAPLLSVRGAQTTEHGPPLSHASNLFPDSRGAVWMRTDEGAVLEQFDHVKKVNLPKGVPDWSPRQFFETKSGELYVYFGRSGVYRRMHETWFKVDLPNQPDDLPLSFFVDKRGRMWIGYVGGKVGMIDGTIGRIFSVGMDVDLGTIQTFLETSEGLLCGGFNGVAVLQGDHFMVLPTVEAAAVTGISGMVQTRKGDLWLNGIHGVSRVSLSDLRTAVSRRQPMSAELYQQTDITGPSPQTYDFPTAVTDANGRIWFNTSGVIAYVDPDEVPHDRQAPNLTVSAIDEDGEPVGKQNQVRAGASTIRIRYFGAHLFAPEKVKYLYRLHGVDKTWQDVDRRTEAVYTHLSPGKYLFEVMATNGEGVWSAPVSASFTVLPAFYQATWFAFLCVLAGVLLLWFGLTVRVRYVTAGIRQRAEERADERIRIARELHDTLLQGVQGLLLSFHVAAEKVPAEHESKRALEKALTRADQIILEGRNRVTRLRSENLTDAELKSLIEGVAADLNVGPINFAVERTGGSDSLQSHVVDEVFCIAREALTNSFRHSQASQISVKLDYQSREFKMTCRDNGRGFNPEASLASPTNGHWGLLGMAERAERIGAKFCCTSAPEKGTEVCVAVPGRLAYARASRFRSLFARNSAVS